MKAFSYISGEDGMVQDEAPFFVSIEAYALQDGVPEIDGHHRTRVDYYQCFCFTILDENVNGQLCHCERTDGATSTGGAKESNFADATEVSANPRQKFRFN